MAHNRARRLAEYAQVRDFSQQGRTMKAIAAQVGRNRRTVKKYRQASTFPERQPRRRRHPTLLDPYTASLLERWNAGCHSATQLCREIHSRIAMLGDAPLRNAKAADIVGNDALLPLKTLGVNLAA